MTHVNAFHYVWTPKKPLILFRLCLTTVDIFNAKAIMAVKSQLRSSFPA